MDDFIKLGNWFFENYITIGSAILVIGGACLQIYRGFKKSSNQKQVINTVNKELTDEQRRNISVRMGQERAAVQKEYEKSINGR